MRTEQINTPGPLTLTKGIGVRRLVIHETLRLLPWPTPTLHRHTRQRPLNQVHLRCGRRFQEVSQRNTLAVCHHPPLRTFALPGEADTRSPFLAGAKLPSAKVSAQSGWPWRPRCRRRRQVLGEGQDGGRSFQRAPLRRTHKIPSKQGRLAIGLGPPQGEACGSGRKGTIFSHCSSPGSLLWRLVSGLLSGY